MPIDLEYEISLMEDALKRMEEHTIITDDLIYAKKWINELLEIKKNSLAAAK